MRLSRSLSLPPFIRRWTSNNTLYRVTNLARFSACVRVAENTPRSLAARLSGVQPMRQWGSDERGEEWCLRLVGEQKSHDERMGESDLDSIDESITRSLEDRQEIMVRGAAESA